MIEPVRVWSVVELGAVEAYLRCIGLASSGVALHRARYDLLELGAELATRVPTERGDGARVYRGPPPRRLRFVAIDDRLVAVQLDNDRRRPPEAEHVRRLSSRRRW